MPRIIRLNVLTALFLLFILNYLPAQDRPAEVLHTPGERYSGVEARQHYQQGKDFYSAGRYEEARNEFERALESISPPRYVTEKTQKEQKVLEIVPSQRLTLEEKEAQKQKEEKEKEKKQKEEKGEKEKGREEGRLPQTGISQIYGAGCLPRCGYCFRQTGSGAG